MTHRLSPSHADSPIPSTAGVLGCLVLTVVLVIAAGCSRSTNGWAFGVGDMAPDFTVVSPDGPWSLSSSHGRARLIVFGASWCPPCRVEMSEITRHLLPRLKHEDSMDVVMILIDATESNVDRLARQMGASGPVYADPGGREYHRLARGGIPRSMVVDSLGRVTYLSVGYGQGGWVELEQQLRAAAR